MVGSSSHAWNRDRRAVHQEALPSRGSPNLVQLPRRSGGFRRRPARRHTARSWYTRISVMRSTPNDPADRNQVRLDSTNIGFTALVDADTSTREILVRSGSLYVCLCVGATNDMVCDAVAAGASTSKEVAAMCGAGADCGRCRCTVRGIIRTALAAAPIGPPNGALKHLLLDIAPVGSR